MSPLEWMRTAVAKVSGTGMKEALDRSAAVWAFGAGAVDAGGVAPGRVRRDFARLVLTAGTPASPPKPSKAGPGRPRGRTSTPAPRHDVIKKAA